MAEKTLVCWRSKSLKNNNKFRYTDSIILYLDPKIGRGGGRNKNKENDEEGETTAGGGRIQNILVDDVIFEDNEEIDGDGWPVFDVAGFWKEKERQIRNMIYTYLKR